MGCSNYDLVSCHNNMELTLKFDALCPAMWDIATCSILARQYLVGCTKKFTMDDREAILGQSYFSSAQIQK